MSCPANCPVCGYDPMHGIKDDDLATQVFILRERLMDECHKSYRLECELAEVEQAPVLSDEEKDALRWFRDGNASLRETAVAMAVIDELIGCDHD